MSRQNNKMRVFIYALLLLHSGNLVASHVDTVILASASMHKPVHNLVIVPDSYITGKKTYPVLYLLHGANDNYKGWLNISPELMQFADQYQMIIVCPDGGRTSWYFDSPVDREIRYETYISSELISGIDKRYRTIKNRSGRAVSGLSMGGHGALYVAFKHQDIFGAAGSTSGVVDIRPFANNYDLPLRLGNYFLFPSVYEKNTVVNMLDLVKPASLKLLIDCGIDDVFLQVNRTLHNKMLEKGIPHDYTERPGGHYGAYWQNSIRYHVVFFNDYFRGKN